MMKIFLFILRGNISVCHNSSFIYYVARLGLQVGYIPGENGRDPGVQGQNSKTKSRGLPIGKPDDSYLVCSFRGDRMDLSSTSLVIYCLYVLLWSYLVNVCGSTDLIWCQAG